ncbi:MAG TPA: DUF427 domain-containing protein [Acidimicrobiales bacterium]|nr:DUF427 domain-containing protein [Acidimicrobiales bacterium]
MSDFPSAPVQTNHVEPVPRRIRAVLAGQTIVDTTQARYVWEWPPFPQYYVPLADVRTDVLVDEGTTEETPRGDVKIFGIELGDVHRPKAAKVLGAAKVEGLDDTVRFEWSAFDAWYEEDEQVFVHPRNPYTRVDSLRSTRTVRVESHGVVLAESSSPVLCFETGLPTRYYLNRTDVDFTKLVPTDTVTSCPYKGTTTGYWSALVEGRTHPDVAWVYDFPTRDVLAIAGLIAFYNEKLDLFLDDVQLDRPQLPRR